MMKRLISCSLLIGAFFLSEAQHGNIKRLLEISNEAHQQHEKRKELLKKITETTGIKSVIRLSSDRIAILKDYIHGLPYYITTHNEQARKTSGVDELQAPEGLNLPLNGEGITIGVWDGGLVRSSHVEFDNRVTNKFGSDFSQHATHVTGTMAAKGVNPQAKGMAPKARISVYYAFDDDLGPMAVEASQGLMISNHSYGYVFGWSFEEGTWSWQGGAESVDTRFGHYSSESKSLDDIAYNAPYYTIVRSAGNDRSDVGDGSRPPDGPFDCLGPGAVAKNVLTVGAITGFDSYSGPESATMSSFSSWGPTDDGRIKPDVVGDGVGVFSTASSADDSYTTLQGTSMAAPNVTGSIALLQQYFRQDADTFMTSAALKSLILHTVRETGVSQGPDYAYGWGVVNVTDAYQVLKSRHGLDTMLIEAQLTSGDQHEYRLFSDGRSPIKATIAWTDVSGSVGTQGSTGLKLVNDLDIRIIDYEGTEAKPWTLNPASPTAQATRADNNRDNVEKIEINNPSPGLYTLRITHKNSLASGSQSYGLTFTGSSILRPEDEIYWVSGPGDVSGSNWSLSSGAEADSGIQPQNKTWVFDNNSLLAAGNVVILNGNAAIKNLIWLNSANSIFDLNGDTLFIDHEMIIQNPDLKIRNGVIVLNATNVRSMGLNFDGSENCTIIFRNQLPVHIQDNIMLSAMVIESNVRMSSQEITLQDLSLINGATVEISDCQVSVTGGFSLGNAQVVAERNNWLFNNANILLSEPLDLLTDSAQLQGTTSVTGSLTIQKLGIDGASTLIGNVETDDLKIYAGTSLSIGDADNLAVNLNFTLESSSIQNTLIKGLSAAAPATIAVNFRELICADFIYLENLSILTESVITVGQNGLLTNVSGATDIPCEDLIFPDFALSFNCANSVLNIENKSVGTIDEYLWDFGNGQFVFGINDVRNPAIVFDEPGVYTIDLIIKNSLQEIAYTKEIEILPNDIANITIIDLDEKLVASLVVPEYTWFLDGIPIPDQTSRTLVPKESGAYRVSYSKTLSACSNRISRIFDYEIITTVEEGPEKLHREIGVFPNPVSDLLTVEGLAKADIVAIIDVSGKVLMEKQILKPGVEIINLQHFRPGVYVLKVIKNSSLHAFKIIKK